MSAYEQKIEARRARRMELADNAAARSSELIRRSGEGLPPDGEPIKIGHHSEKRHRAALKRSHALMDRACIEDKKSDYHREKAATIGKGGISSDDPDALVKLRAKLAREVEAHEQMKRVNAAYRKHAKGNDKALDGLSISEAQIVRKFEPCALYSLPFASFQLTNSNNRIKATKSRIAALEARADLETKVTQGNGYELIENAEENRIQFVFDGKPCDEVRATLKALGFRWACSQGAWQRHLNNAGRLAATCVVEKMARA